MHRNVRGDAMWCAENWDAVAQSLCNAACTYNRPTLCIFVLPTTPTSPAKSRSTNRTTTQRLSLPRRGKHWHG